MYQIEISHELDLYNKYLFVPVMVSDAALQISFDDVTELEPMINIGQVYVESFLSYFLIKYFDTSLDENKRRITCGCDGDHDCVFEKRKGYNFYTYESIKAMVEDLRCVANLLEKDYDNPFLAPIIEQFDIHYVHDPESDVWTNGDFGEMQEHVHVVCDFYRRLAQELVLMMEQSPMAHLINIEYGY